MPRLTNIGGGEVTEDVPHVSGEEGFVPMAVRQDGLAVLAGDGDYIPIVVDANGRLYVTAIATGNTSIIRGNAAGTSVILNGAHLSGALDFSDYTMLTVHMPAAWTAAFIGFHVSTTLGGTYIPLSDENGNLVQTATAVVSTAIEVPAELAGCRFVKLWSQNGAGANVAQGADRVMLLDLKA